MVKNVIPVWKKQGWTPLTAIEEFKKSHHEYKDEKVSYAGRLDPMAEGVLLLLIGNENKKRKDYEKLSKTYETEIVLGITTDSFDALGLIINVSFDKISPELIKRALGELAGKQMQKYPPYSSQPVLGKPLYWWARENRIPEIEIPEKKIEIYKLDLISISEIKTEDLHKEVVEKIKRVKGEFRQKEILKNWEKFYLQNKLGKFVKIKLEIECSSGTYIRRLADDIGRKLGCGAFSILITRTKVGKISEDMCFKF